MSRAGILSRIETEMGMKMRTRMISTAPTHVCISEILWPRYPFERISQLGDGVGEALDVPGAIVEEVQTWSARW